MSTPTEHLGLHQWEANDDFLRTDFNEDFAKIDAATGALQAWAASASAAGSYTVTDKQAFTIELGFRPRLAIFLTESFMRTMVVMMDGYAIEAYMDHSSMKNGLSAFSAFSFTDSGISIRASCDLNYNTGDTVRYVAFR